MANLLVYGVLVVLSSALTLADICQDGAGNWQTCDNMDYYDLVNTQCCKCTGGCCTSEENDACDAARSVLTCQDANGDSQTCALDSYENECCKCTGGCCTSEENDVCETAKGIWDKLPVWAWIAIGVGGLVFLLLVIIGICCCCGCCACCRGQTMTSVVTSGPAAQGYVAVSTTSSSRQIPMTNPVSAGGPYVEYKKLSDV